ncbi:hypothetical protein HNR19_003393 [Nocardioides thalensis]|uniref:YdhG-like domain-containing protein n=1 Tax=Nocardioides thalensis TaxID=1914755 RepID=A0A853C4M4_9ACTN|nr:DUF1801 domain-containing protein [Nocardioides thalensis]NYJ02695.1 hypothetical protein [Nocardioides thalensis]
MSDVITDYFTKAQPWQRDVGEQLRELVHAAVPGVEERLQYGKPHFLKDGHYAAVIHNAKDKVTFMVFNATEVDGDGWRSLGKGDRKAAEFREGQSVDVGELAGVLATTTATL